jgi:hypothetical protein
MLVQTDFFHLLPDEEWAVSVGHKVFPDGTRFLVRQQWAEGVLLCWRDGVEPPLGVLGTLLHECYVRPFRCDAATR